jgi:DNA-directed RNA polymerase subunit alpha
VGVLPVDAIFSPVRKVNYNVERTRVGQVTDYERLVLEVWTDGTIKPEEAVRRAAETLVNHFFLFSNLDRVAEAGLDRTPLLVSPEIYQTPIERLDLSPRTLNCLKRAHITKVGEVLEMADDELLKIKNFGEKSLDELHEKLKERGMTSQGGEPAVADVAVDEDIGTAEPAGALSAISMEDLGDLMGSGSSIVPAVEQSGSDEDATEDADGDVDAVDNDDEEDSS